MKKEFFLINNWKAIQIKEQNWHIFTNIYFQIFFFLLLLQLTKKKKKDFEYWPSLWQPISHLYFEREISKEYTWQESEVTNKKN